MEGNTKEQIILKKQLEVIDFDDGEEESSYLLRYDGHCWRISKLVYITILSLHENSDINKALKHCQEKYQIEVRKVSVK